MRRGKPVPTGEETWVERSANLKNGAGRFPEGLDVGALNSDFTHRTGRREPCRQIIRIGPSVARGGEEFSEPRQQTYQE